MGFSARRLSPADPTSPRREASLFDLPGPRGPASFLGLWNPAVAAAKSADRAQPMSRPLINAACALLTGAPILVYLLGASEATVKRAVLFIVVFGIAVFLGLIWQALKGRR